MSINVAGQTVSFIYTEFPIASFYSVYIYNCDFSFPMTILAMPGSYVYVDENSIIKFTNIYDDDQGYYIYGRLAVFDTYPYMDATFTNSKGNVVNNIYYPTKNEFSFSNAKIDMNGIFQFNTSNTDTSTDYKFYTLGGNINLSNQAYSSLNANKAYIKLSNYQCIYKYYEYYSQPAQYYSDALISNNKVYFQLTTGGDILSGEILTNGLYSYNGSYYFYIYNSSSRSSFGYTSIFGAADAKPYESRMLNKYANMAGNFKKADSFIYIDEDKGAYYVTNSSNTYVKVAGLFIPITANSTYITDGYINNISLPNAYKFNVSHSDYSISTELYWNYLTNRWKFTK